MTTMPPLPHDAATLDEVLEVRGEPLIEEEIWALLIEAGLALRSHLSKGHTQEKIRHLTFTLNPDTVLLGLNGKIKFAILKDTSFKKADKHFIAPECFTKDGRYNFKIDKMLVYSLGVTALTASERSLLPVHYSVSVELESLLCSMVEDDPLTRATFSEVLKICYRHIDAATSYMKIKAMAAEIVGPYGLDPGFYEMELKLPIPGDITTNRNRHDRSITPAEPVQDLMALSKHSGKGMTIDITDFRSHESNEYDERPSYQIITSRAWDSDRPDHHENDENNDGILSPRSFQQTDLPEVPAQSQKKSEYPAWSPTFSSPDFQALMDVENKKLAKEGYLHDASKVISPLKNYKSMPSLRNAEDMKNAMFSTPQVVSRQHSEASKISRHRSMGHIEERTSVNSPTSQYSSQISLTHGAYVLDGDIAPNWTNDSTLKRYGSGSNISQYSDDGSRMTSTVQPPQYRPIELPHLGPEFIRIASNPDTAFVDITPPRLGPLPKGTRQIAVILPNTQKVQTNVQVNSKGKDLFDQIAGFIGVKETVYFGLTQIRDEEHLFIDLDAKLSKYAPAGWKDENPKKQKSEFLLHFKVKFFIDNPSLLKHRVTTHIYFLQLRQDILKSYTHCPDDVLFSLASFALQAEYGPFEPEYHNTEYFRLEHYIPGRVLSRMSRMELLRSLPLMHQSHNCNSTYEAEMGFLEETKKLPEYGVIFHKVSRSKKIESDIVWLGICVKGILILEPKGKLRAAVHKQAWNLIKEFTFEKKKFIIKPKDPDQHPKMVFYTNHYRRSKYLFKMCQSFHRFQAFNQNRTITSSNVSRQASTEYSGSKNEVTSKRGKKPPLPPSKDNLDSHSTSAKKGVVLVTLDRQPSEGLGITIVGGENAKEISQGIFIKFIKEGSVCAKNGLIHEGDKILSVNGCSLEAAHHDEAVKILRNAGNHIELIISKSALHTSKLEKSSLIPVPDQSQLARENFKGWPNDLKGDRNYFHTLKNKLSGIDFVDEEESDSFNERPIDVPNPTPNKYPQVTIPSNQSSAVSIAETKSRNTISQVNDDAKPQGFIVNDIHINHDEESLISDESDIESERSSVNQQPIKSSGLKRFGNFEDLNKLSFDEIDKPFSLSEKERDAIDELLNSPEDQFQAENGHFMNETIEEIEVVLARRNGSFGLSIMGGKGSSLPLEGIFIKSLQPNGAAEATQKIQIGDRILSVNGVSYENISHDQAVDILKRSGDTMSITLDRGIELSDEYLKSYTNSPTPRSTIESFRNHNKEVVFEADVLKSKDDSLGLSLVGGKDSDLIYKDQIIIRKMFPGQPMDRSGQFKIGDVLLAVNDQILEGMTHAEALSVIRNAPKVVRIIVKRPDEKDIPEELLANSRPVSPEKLLQDFQSKDIEVEGRESRHGNRIAKQLLQSITFDETDNSSCNLNYSHGYSSDENENLPREERRDQTYTEERLRLPLNPSESINTKTPDKTLTTGDSISTDSIRNLTLPKKPIQKNDKMVDPFPLATSTPSPMLMMRKGRDDVIVKTMKDNGGERKNNVNLPPLPHPKSSFRKENKVYVTKENDLRSQRKTSDTSSSASDSPLGTPRHRPSPKLSKADGVEQIQLDTEIETSVDNRVVKSIQITHTNDNRATNLNGDSHSSPPSKQIAPFSNDVDFFKDASVIGASNGTPTKRVSSLTGSPVLKQLDASSRRSFDLRRNTSVSSASSSNGEIIHVQLEKSEKGLGITLGTLLENNEPFVYIRKIVPGSAAEENGQLKTGDRLMSVNGQNIEDMNQKDVVTLFRNIVGVVSIECYRPPDQPLQTPKPTTPVTENLLPELPRNNVGVKLTSNLAENSGFRVMSKKTKSAAEELSHNSNILQETKFSNSSVACSLADGSSLLKDCNGSSDEKGMLIIDSPSPPCLFNTTQNDLPVPIEAKAKLGESKSVLSPKRPPSTPTGMNKLNSQQISESQDSDIATELKSLRLNELVIPAPPPFPEINDDDDEWSSTEEIKTNDLSLSGMDTDGILHDTDEEHSTNLDSLFQFEDSLENKLNKQTQSSLVISETQSRDTLDRASCSPQVKESKVTVETSSRGSSRSGIPRLIRSRSNSRSNSGISETEDSPRYSKNIKVTQPAKRKSTEEQHFVERRNFVFYSKNRLEKLIENIDDKLDSVEINSEFMCLRQINTSETTDVAMRACNRDKNRNKVVLPYDSNRVRLSGGEESDYINASYVKLPVDQKVNTYIITQAPLKNTVDDFWRCVWENKVELIVMLVKPVENGKERCVKYWPNVTGSPQKILDKYEVDLLYEEENESFTYRQIQLRNSKMDKSLFITQAAFTKWPDNGVPTDVIDFLAFIKFIRNFPTASPTLIHCSNGVGRSGIYVIIDTIWDIIEHDIMFDLSQTTKLAKQQRQLLIQTKEQYQYCYRVIRELIADLL